MALAAVLPGIRPTTAAQTEDGRVVRDRLHPANNAGHGDFGFLNAVGVVWAGDTRRSLAGSTASTGFLIDRCHVLTNKHVVYRGDAVNSTPGEPAAFAVGQTGDSARGALEGLDQLFDGEVVAVGDSILLDDQVHGPADDWALIKLARNVGAGITPLSLGSVDTDELSHNARVAVAGFPADLRRRRGDALRFKDLWGSEGRVVGVIFASTAAALIDTTVQATRGESGGPVYGDFQGRRHLVIGMVQAIRGNGIDLAATGPNQEILFTSELLERIAAAQSRTPCP